MSQALDCPFCTYKNEPHRFRCAICNRGIRKRSRKEEGTPELNTSATSNAMLDSNVIKKNSNLALATDRSPKTNNLHTFSEGSIKDKNRRVETLFTTASGKAVTVSDELLKAAEAKLGDASSGSAGQAQLAARTGTLGHNEKPGAITARKNIAQDENHRVETLFTTASGKAVTVSDELLKAAEAKLGDASSGSAGQAQLAARTGTLGHNEKRSDTDLSESSEKVNPTMLLGKRKNSFHPPLQRSSTTDDLTADRVHQSFSTDYSEEKRTLRVAPSPASLLRFSWRNHEAPLVINERWPLSFTEFLSLWSLDKLGSLVNGLDEGYRKLHQYCNSEGWQSILIRLAGVDPSYASNFWCRQALLSALFLLRSLCGSIGIAGIQCSAVGVLMCLVRQYNLEHITNGECSPIQQMVNGKILPALPCILFVSSTDKNFHVEDSTTHPNEAPASWPKMVDHRCTITLSDGFRHVQTVVDSPLAQLVQNGTLAAGQRIAVCGSKLLDQPLLSRGGGCSGASVGKCVADALLEIQYNCTRPVHPFAALGLTAAEPVPLPIASVHPDGGVIPAMEVVILEHLPQVYVSTQAQSKSILAENKYFRDNNGVVPAGSCRAKVLSCLVKDHSGHAVIQRWEDCDKIPAGKSNDTAFPSPGTRVTFYALLLGGVNKCEQLPSPLCDARVFYSTQLHFRSLGVDGGKAEVESGRVEVKEAITCSQTSVPNGFSGILIKALPFDLGFVVLFALYRDDQESSSFRFALLFCPQHSEKLHLDLPSTLIEKDCEAFKTVVVVQYPSLICRENENLDADCILYALNVYTRIEIHEVGSYQDRPELMNRECPSVYQLTHLSKTLCERKALLNTRAEEIFRVIFQFHFASLTRKMNLFLPFHADIVKQLSFSNEMGMLRVEKKPHYLRTTSHAPETLGTQTSVKAAFTDEEWRKRVCVQHPKSLGQDLPHYDYGNIVSLSLISSSMPHNCHCSTAEEEFVLFDAHSEFKEQEASLLRRWLEYQQTLHYMKITWRYGIEGDSLRSAIVKDPVVLHGLLEPILPVRTILKDAAENRTEEYIEARSKLFHLWEATPSKGCSAKEQLTQLNASLWHSVLRSTKVGESLLSQRDAGKTPLFFPWAPREWLTVLEMVYSSLMKKPLLRFIRGEHDELARVYVITLSTPLETIS